MIKAKIKSKKNGKTQKILKNLKTLSKNYVEVGHFEESGLHTDSDLTHPELLKIWAYGLSHGGVIKNPLANFTANYIRSGKFLKDKKATAIYNKWASNLLKESSTNMFLEEMGIYLRGKYSEVFGQVGLYMPIVGSNTTPMLETGELASKSAYRTSTSNQVKELI